MIQRGSSSLVSVSPVFPFWWFLEPFLGISVGKFWGRFFEGFLLDVTYVDLVPLFLVILLEQTLWNGFNLGVFGVFLGKVFSRVDIQFLLIEWVLGNELLAKGSPRGTPAIPKVSLGSMERIGRSIGWSVKFFPQTVFFLTVQAKPAWPVSQTVWPVLALWAVVKGFWARVSLSCYGFSCSKEERFLRCFGLGGVLGSFWTKSDWPASKNGLTSFPCLLRG
jgi:hypothetical protein